MGVAIHYRLITDDLRTVIASLKIAREEAEKAGYRCRYVEGYGIIVPCETAGSFALVFRKRGRYYICSHSTRTQPFFSDEVEPNLRWHKWICALLKKLERLKWRGFHVNDGAGYYDIWDESKIIKEFQLHAQFIYKFITTYDEMTEKQGLYTIFILGGRRALDVRRLRKKGVKNS